MMVIERFYFSAGGHIKTIFFAKKHLTNPEKFDRIKKRQRNLICCPYQEKGVDGKKDAVRSLQRAVGWCETVEEKQDTSSLSRSAELLMGKVSIDGILPL